MASTRTICTECKSVVTLPEPAEVGDVVPCPKCEAYFQVPRTKIVPTPGAAKPAQAAPAKAVAAVPVKPKPKVVVEAEAVDEDLDFSAAPPAAKKKPVAVVEDDDDADEEEEEEEKPKKKKKDKSGGGGGKKKKKKKRDEDSYKNSPVRFIILGVLVLVMLVGAYFLYKKEWVKPDIIVTKPDEEVGKPISQADIDANIAKAGKNKGGNPKPLNSTKTQNDLKELALAYITHCDNGQPPKTANDLLPLVENNAKLIQEITGGNLVFLFGGDTRKVPAGASNTVIGYVYNVPERGGFVVMADGSVRNMNVAEFQAAAKLGK